MTVIRTFTGFGLTDATVIDDTTAGTGDDPFSVVNGTWTVDTSTSPRPPALAFTKASGATGNLRYNDLGSLQAYCVAFDFEIDALPTETNTLFDGWVLSGDVRAVRVQLTGTNAVRIFAGSTQVEQAGTGVLQAGVRYRMEMAVTAGVEGHAYVYEGDSTTPVITAGGSHTAFGALDSAWAGPSNNNTAEFTLHVDDVRIGDTAALLGPGSDPATGVAQLVHAWPGVVNAGSLAVSFKATGASTATLYVSMDPTFTLGNNTSDAVALVDEVALCSVSGVQNDTTYHYGVKLDNEPVEYVGTFRGPPSNGPLRVLFGSCQQTGSNHVVFDRMAEEGADSLIHCGDLHYEDIATDDPAAFRAALDTSIGTDRFQSFTRNTPWTYMWDNHDFGGTGSWSGSAMAPAAKAVMKQYQPAEHLAGGTWSSDEFWRTWKRNIGGSKDVRFIHLDQRTWRSDPAGAPGPTKTMLGATQKAWFKDLLVNDAPFTDLFVIATHGVWYQTGSDRWSTYADEFKELAQHIEDNGLTGKCLFIGGDLHALWFDSGTLISPGLTFPLSPQAGGAAFNQGGTESSMPFSGGVHPNESGRGQYGALDFSVGNGVITVRYRGMQDDGAELVGGTLQFGSAIDPYFVEYDGNSTIILDAVTYDGVAAATLTIAEQA